MTNYNLYGSEGCHLCEEALALCLLVIPNKQLRKIDIVNQETVAHESKTLVELYGVHIPVLEKLNPEGIAVNHKLFWPFTAAQITQLIEIDK